MFPQLFWVLPNVNEAPVTEIQRISFRKHCQKKEGTAELTLWFYRLFISLDYFFGHAIFTSTAHAGSVSLSRFWHGSLSNRKTKGFPVLCFHCFGEATLGWQKCFLTRQWIVLPSNSKLLNLCDGVFLCSGDSNLIELNSDSPRMQRPQPILNYQPDHEEDTGMRLRRGC